MSESIRTYTLKEVEDSRASLHQPSKGPGLPQDGKHNAPALIVLHNKVYDIKDLLHTHPGGAVINSQLGKDGSDPFDTFHPPFVHELLEKYYVGELEQNAQITPNVKSTFANEIRDLREKLLEDGLYDSDKIYYIMKLLSNILILAISMVILVKFGNQSTLATIISASLLALFWQQCGWLAHDFLHHQVFQERGWNDFAGYLVGNIFQGFSVTWWKNKHNLHHTLPNVHDADPDIDTMPFLAWSEFALDFFSEFSHQTTSKWLVSNQPFLYFPLLSIARLSWAWQSIMTAVSGTGLSDQIGIVKVFLEQLTLSLHWTWYLGAAFYYLSLGKALLFLFTSQCVCGVLLAVVFSLNHNGMPVVTKEEAKNLDFYSLQVITGRDVFPSWFVTWFTGGLNYQIEHHLFPSLPRHHFHRVQPIVQDLCEKYQVKYHRTSFYTGTKEVLDRLNEISKLSQKLWDIGERVQ